jgi:hypothetical protein
VNSANDLFGKSTFLAWLPGETLFSLISRHHCFWGHPLAARTCEQFFGHSRAGSQHDLPSRLSHFVARTEGCFGDVEKVAKHHTLLAYYAAFISADELANAIACVASGSVAHLKLRLGILTSRFRANHPLKACEACMDEDRADFGWAYWHGEHQYPGVWICQKHDQLLKESNLKANGVERFQWHLPSKAHFRELQIEQQDAITHAHAAIQGLSRQVTDLVTQSAHRAIEAGRLHEVYRAELVRRGWVTAGGSFRMQEMALSFLGHVKHLRVLPELEAFPTTVAEAVPQLGRLLRPPRSGTHPLRHLVLINWLFGTADAFWLAYSAALNSPVSLPNEAFPSAGQPDSDGNDPRREQLISMLSLQKQSFRMAAKVIGIDVGTAMAWAAQAGLAVPRRPKKLTGSLRQQTIMALRNGTDKTVAATIANVSVVTITKLLLSEVGLHDAWCHSREKRARTSARKVWLRLLQSQPGLGVKLMRAVNPAAYAWLYRNDRAWLDDHKPTLLAITMDPCANRVLWVVRDKSLSAEVERAVLALRERCGARPLKLWQIYQLVLALKPKLAALDRLPLTRRVIEQALQRRGDGREGPDLFA